MSIKIEEVTEVNKSECEKFILSRSDTTFVDRWSWRSHLEKNYPYDHYWYVTKDASGVTGFLGLTLVDHWFFGRYLATAPFANQGGFYWTTEESKLGLLQKANELQCLLKTKYVLLRNLGGHERLPDEWVRDSVYATYHLNLMNNPKDFYNTRLRAKRRHQVKKSKSHGLTTKFGSFDLLDDFWFVISQSMKELGSPYHSKKYLKTLLEMPDMCPKLVVVYDVDKKPAGCSLLVQHNNVVIQLHANTLRKYRALNLGDFLYWSVIEHSCNQELKFLDMGRSLIGSGNEDYKLKWNPHKTELDYWYLLGEGEGLPHVNQGNPKYKRAISLWQSLPLAALKIVGPKIISGIV